MSPPPKRPRSKARQKNLELAKKARLLAAALLRDAEELEWSPFSAYARSIEASQGVDAAAKFRRDVRKQVAGTRRVVESVWTSAAPKLAPGRGRLGKKFAGRALKSVVRGARREGRARDVLLQLALILRPSAITEAEVKFAHAVGLLSMAEGKALEDIHKRCVAYSIQLGRTFYDHQPRSIDMKDRRELAAWMVKEIAREIGEGLRTEREVLASSPALVRILEHAMFAPAIPELQILWNSLGSRSYDRQRVLGEKLRERILRYVDRRGVMQARDVMIQGLMAAGMNAHRAHSFDAGIRKAEKVALRRPHRG